MINLKRGRLSILFDLVESPERFPDIQEEITRVLIPNPARTRRAWGERRLLDNVFLSRVNITNACLSVIILMYERVIFNQR